MRFTAMDVGSNAVRLILSRIDAEGINTSELYEIKNVNINISLLYSKFCDST